MTKILMNIELQAYQQDMKESLRKVLQHNYIGGIRQFERAEPPLAREHLLPPPDIMCLALQAYQGHGDDFIAVVALHEFGIHGMHITIWDDQGNRIERGEVFPDPKCPEMWDYLTTARVPCGTTVVVEVTAVDCMGGVRICRESKTMGEADW
jgi:hypothetical protein